MEEPARPDFAGPSWREGSSHNQSQDDTDDEVVLRVLDDEWLLLSSTYSLPNYMWYSTAGASSFFITCASDDHRTTVGRVNRELFLERAATRKYDRVGFRYDADHNVGRFEVTPSAYEDLEPCAGLATSQR